MRELTLVLGTIAFVAFHLFWYTRVVAYWLWEHTGGIQHYGRLTVYGTCDWAWTVPVHLPAGLAFAAGHGGMGLAFVVTGSLAAGFASAELLRACRDRPVLGPWRWRLWLFLACWVWVPVPAPVSWVCQWTVVY
jgi:hypothetical protein